MKYMEQSKKRKKNIQMTNLVKIFLVLCLTSCTHSSNLKPEDTKVSRSAEMQQEINYLLSLDESYKTQEKMYLEEIRKAQIHNDEIAFEFFLREYAKVKRLDLPDWIKKEPNYVEGGIKVKY